MPAEIERYITVTLDPLDYVRELIADRDIKDSLNVIADILEKIPFVEAAEFGHLNYVKIGTDTGDFALAERRVNHVTVQVRVALKRWANTLPKKN